MLKQVATKHSQNRDFFSIQSYIYTGISIVVSIVNTDFSNKVLHEPKS